MTYEVFLTYILLPALVVFLVTRLMRGPKLPNPTSDVINSISPEYIGSKQVIIYDEYLDYRKIYCDLGYKYKLSYNPMLQMPYLFGNPLTHSLVVL